jgi:hypothetical protein
VAIAVGVLALAVLVAVVAGRLGRDSGPAPAQPPAAVAP